MRLASSPLRLRRRGVRGDFQIHAIVALLVTALGVVVLLALRAHYAITSHRAMAEEVLRDYAALVGDEALRRIAVQVGLYGYREAFRALRAEAAGAAPGEPLAAGDSSENKSFELIDRAFLFDRSTQRLSVLEGRELVDAWLVTELDRVEPTDETEFQILHAELSGRPVSVVAGALPAPSAMA